MTRVSLCIAAYTFLLASQVLAQESGFRGGADVIVVFRFQVGISLAMAANAAKAAKRPADPQKLFRTAENLNSLTKSEKRQAALFRVTLRMPSTCTLGDQLPFSQKT